jgi:hypothetical protein
MAICIKQPEATSHFNPLGNVIILYTSLPLSLQKFRSLAPLVYGILLLLLFAKINYTQVKFEYDKKMLGKPSNIIYGRK